MQDKEYVVRVPSDLKKKFHVMRFSAALNVDINKFKHCKMDRELIFKDHKNFVEEEQPEFGAGSEFGRKEKEEARRKKFEKRKNKQNNSPWILKVGGKHGKKYKGIREGGVTENTSYYVFFQATDGAFEAFPVQEWYNFTPFQRYKALSAEEAEEKFNKRDQILNYFSLKTINKTKGESKEGTDESNKKIDKKTKKEFKVSDMDDWFGSENEEMSDQDSDDDFKPKKIKKEKKDKRKKDDEDSDDDEPKEDSDEGDYDDKEVDYMSDESSGSESEEEKVDLKGVEDESALRDLVVSEEDEEEEKPEIDEQTDDPTKAGGVDKAKPIKSEKLNASDSLSDSDLNSDSSDIDEPKSALLFLTKTVPPKNVKIKSEPEESITGITNNSQTNSTSSTNVSSPSTSNNNQANQDQSNGLKLKRKLENVGQVTQKKMKIENDSTLQGSSAASCGNIEEAVKRYLKRKPMTIIDLLKKLKNRNMNLDDMPIVLSGILRKLNPEKQVINQQSYFSLKPEKS